MIKVPKWFVVASLCFVAGLAFAGSLKVWSTSERILAADLNANFAYIMNNFVGGQGARLVDSDVASNAGIQWTKLASGGASTTGSWTTLTETAVVTGTVYGGFQMAGTMSSGIKFGEVTCTSLLNAGVGTAGTLAIYNVTDSTTLCSGSFTCTSAIDVAVPVFNCNTAPLATKTYAIDLTGACGSSNPHGLICNIEIIH